ncbi:hypothetical protein Ahia01_001156500, partial [Argonauta hians]
DGQGGGGGLAGADEPPTPALYSVFPDDNFIKLERTAQWNTKLRVAEHLKLLKLYDSGEQLLTPELQQVRDQLASNQVPWSWLQWTYVTPSAIGAVDVKDWVNLMLRNGHVLKKISRDFSVFDETHDLTVYMRPDRLITTFVQSYSRKTFADITKVYIKAKLEPLPAQKKPHNTVTVQAMVIAGGRGATLGDDGKLFVADPGGAFTGSGGSGGTGSSGAMKNTKLSKRWKLRPGMGTFKTGRAGFKCGTDVAPAASRAPPVTYALVVGVSDTKAQPAKGLQTHWSFLTFAADAFSPISDADLPPYNCPLVVSLPPAAPPSLEPGNVVCRVPLQVSEKATYFSGWGVYLKTASSAFRTVDLPFRSSPCPSIVLTPPPPPTLVEESQSSLEDSAEGSPSDATELTPTPPRGFLKLSTRRAR